MNKPDKGYMALMEQFPLRPIRHDEDLKAASAIIERLGNRVVEGKKLSAWEVEYLDALGLLMGNYEYVSGRIKQLRSSLSAARSPEQILQSFMQDHGLTQSALAQKIGCQQSVISEFLAGKRGLSKLHIARLADLFSVSSDLFLPKVSKKPKSNTKLDAIGKIEYRSQTRRKAVPGKIIARIAATKSSKRKTTLHKGH